MRRNLGLCLTFLFMGSAGAFAASFAVPNSDCLVDECHGAGAAATRLNIAARYDFDSVANNDGVLSQHNIEYTQDGNFATIDAPNGCKVCHVADPSNPAAHRYVSAQIILAYPDAYGSHASGELISNVSTTSQDFSTYQDFCLSCHDGSGLDPTMSGPLPAQQVGPTSRTNPTAQQSVPFHVPPVPSKEASSAVNSPAFFDYYETNGHGVANALISASPMNVTCLAGGAGQGCHNAHGGTNRFLLDDLFGTGMDAASEVAVGLCYSCHDPAINFAQAGSASGFHGWIGGDTVLHDDTMGSPQDGMSEMRAFSGNMNITVLGTASGILPFYPGNTEAEKIHQRAYPGDLSSGSHWVMCLTCHDPHGTDDTSAGSIGGAFLQPGMLRVQADLANAADLYAEPLCAECHN